jgi:hypothetical protein
MRFPLQYYKVDETCPYYCRSWPYTYGQQFKDGNMSSFSTHPTSLFQFNYSAGIKQEAIDAFIRSLYLPHSKFSLWFERCWLNNITIKYVFVEAITMFGPNIGFVYFTADAEDQAGNKLPGSVFLRGDSVCCLLVVEENNGDGALGYSMVLVEEIKLPVGRAILQTPAGMLDVASGCIRGKMVDEVKEETGIEISSACVNYKEVSSRELLYNTLIQFDDFFPSQGGCDESLKVFAYVCRRTTEELAAIHGSIKGNKAEHEQIKVHVKPLTWALIDETMDSKLIVVASKFDRLFPGVIGI